jgi:hypothetical protein
MGGRALDTSIDNRLFGPVSPNVWAEKGGDVPKSRLSCGGPAERKSWISMLLGAIQEYLLSVLFFLFTRTVCLRVLEEFEYALLCCNDDSFVF